MTKAWSASNKRSFFLLKRNSEPEIGFTTGTCAACASIAAVRMLLSKKNVPYVFFTTPKGIKILVEIRNQIFTETYASCSVKKIAGNDPDVTDGIEIFSHVEKKPFVEGDSAGKEKRDFQIEIDGGFGVGRVTLPGLDQKPGMAAINSVPRKMILEGIKAELKKEKCSAVDFGICVEISVPEGEKVAEKTFNPKLGIFGGISILGTSGIVEPMSEQAILDTIQVEINVRKAQGYKILPMVPGNYGADFLSENFSFSVESAVHTSNFIYDSLKMAEKSGFRKIIFCGHIGKLVKVAGGIKNTHSKYGDHRMEILCDIAKEIFPGEDFSPLRGRLMECISTEQAVNVLDELDENHLIRQKIMKELARRVHEQMCRWTDGKIEIEIVLFTKEKGCLARWH